MTQTSLNDALSPRAELVDPSVTIRFMLAGNAHVTFQSRRTGTRFTYRVQVAEPRGDDRAPSPVAASERSRLELNGPHFVSVLTGPDYYEYLGCIFDGRRYAHGRKSRIGEDAPSAVAFEWVWARLVRLVSGDTRNMTVGWHPELSVWHEGRCGACGRRLTTPESVARGLGPICEGRSSSFGA